MQLLLQCPLRPKFTMCGGPVFFIDTNALCGGWTLKILSFATMPHTRRWPWLLLNFLLMCPSHPHGWPLTSFDTWWTSEAIWHAQHPKQISTCCCVSINQTSSWWPLSLLLWPAHAETSSVDNCTQPHCSSLSLKTEWREATSSHWTSQSPKSRPHALPCSEKTCRLSVKSC